MQIENSTHAVQRNLWIFYLALCLEGLVFGEMSVTQLLLSFLILPQHYIPCCVAVLDISIYIAGAFVSMSIFFLICLSAVQNIEDDRSRTPIYLIPVGGLHIIFHSTLSSLGYYVFTTPVYRPSAIPFIFIQYLQLTLSLFYRNRLRVSTIPFSLLSDIYSFYCSYILFTIQNRDFSTALLLIFGASALSAQASVFAFGHLTSLHVVDSESDTLTR